MGVQVLKSKKRELRRVWSPQRPEAAEQCPSCPFRAGNNDEWLAICQRLAVSEGVDPESVDPHFARFNVMREVSDRGDFNCHHTAYNADMTRRDDAELRQCPGASAFFRDGGL